eukprot:1289017-Pleurochrysis_carterae.AAC.2
MSQPDPEAGQPLKTELSYAKGFGIQSAMQSKIVDAPKERCKRECRRQQQQRSRQVDADTFCFRHDSNSGCQRGRGDRGGGVGGASVGSSRDGHCVP